MHIQMEHLSKFLTVDAVHYITYCGGRNWRYYLKGLVQGKSQTVARNAQTCCDLHSEIVGNPCTMILIPKFILD